MTVVERAPEPAALPTFDGPYRSLDPLVDWSVFMATEGGPKSAPPRYSTLKHPVPCQRTATHSKTTDYWPPIGAPAQSVQTKTPEPLPAKLPDVDWSAFMATEAPIIEARRSMTRGPSTRSQSSPPPCSPSPSSSRSPSFNWASIQPYDATSPSFRLAAPHHEPGFRDLQPRRVDPRQSLQDPPSDERNPVNVPTVKAPAPSAPFKLDFSSLDIQAPVLQTGTTPMSTSSSSPSYSPRERFSSRSLTPTGPVEVDWSVFIAQETALPSLRRSYNDDPTLMYSSESRVSLKYYVDF